MIQRLTAVPIFILLVLQMQLPPLFGVVAVVSAFQIQHCHRTAGPCSSSSTAAATTAATSNSNDGFRKELAVLQELGIPLLSCDADQVHSFSTALWSLLDQIYQDKHAQTTCLVLEQIPVSALQALVDDYEQIQTSTPRLTKDLPELERIQLALVGDNDNDSDGNGADTRGPALLIQSTAQTTTTTTNDSNDETIFDETKCTEALQAFVQRIVVNEEACPYTKDPNYAATGLEKRGITPGPVAYRFSDTSNVFGAMAAFWRATSEVLTTPEADLSTTMLSLPAIGPDTTSESHDRFVAVTELMGRNLCLFRGDGAIGLVHFHPAYERNRVRPMEKPAYGHLPPQSWLPAMLKLNGNGKEAAEFTDEQYRHSDYQRRSPHTAINILRAAQLNAAVGGKSIVDLDVHGDGSVMEAASGISTYSRNAIRLANIDRAVLDAGIAAERAMMIV